MKIRMITMLLGSMLASSAFAAPADYWGQILSTPEAKMLDNEMIAKGFNLKSVEDPEADQAGISGQAGWNLTYVKINFKDGDRTNIVQSNLERIVEKWNVNPGYSATRKLE